MDDYIMEETLDKCGIRKNIKKKDIEWDLL